MKFSRHTEEKQKEISLEMKSLEMKLESKVVNRIRSEMTMVWIFKQNG
jgi:hypothetical protein